MLITTQRALVYMPEGEDASVTTLLVREGRQAHACANLNDFLDELVRGAGLAILSGRKLTVQALAALEHWLETQPPWSDFPFIILDRGEPEQGPNLLIEQLQATLGNVIVLNHPFHPSALLNMVDNALRGRRRQYQARQYLEAKAESEERLKTALLAGRMGSFELNIVDYVLDGTPQFKALYGRRADELFNFADLIECVVDADQVRVQRAMDDSIFTRSDLVLEHRVRWPDGTLHWIDVRARVVFDRFGAPNALVGVSSDITERKYAEAQRDKLLAAVSDERERTHQSLRGEKALSALLLTSVPAGIVAYDTELNVTIWNPFMERLFHRAEHQVKGKSLPEIFGDRIGFEVAQRLADALAGVSGPVEEIELRTPTHGEVVLESQHAPLRGGEGQIVGGVAFFREITERRRAEEQLRQAQKMETIGQLTGGVAHDFNNLLAVIQGNVEMLRKKMPADPQLNRYIEGALTGAQRGASLTARLLAFARRQDLRTEPTDLHTLVDGMMPLLERSVGPLSVIELEVEDNLPPATVDANQLEMALLNLAVNARDAMADGGTLTIRLDAQDGRALGMELDGKFVRLSVSDTGTGMDEYTLKNAIDPFFSTKEIGKGTGLGLSMVHGLAEQLGGNLRLSSTIGSGTTAELWLPVSASPVKEAQKVEDQPIIAPRASTILVVDDDALINMNTADMVTDLGHTVIEAYSGKQALGILENNPEIALIISDYAMPGMTGVELAAKAQQLRPDLPVLLATGYADLPSGTTTDLPRLSKPYQQSDLERQIAQLLGPK